MFNSLRLDLTIVRKLQPKNELSPNKPHAKQAIAAREGKE